LSGYGFTIPFAAFLMIASLLSGCSRGYSRFLKLPADPSIATGLGWAAVTSAYAHARKSPDMRSPDAALVRRGTVFQCLERRIDPEGQDVGGLWYRYGDAAPTESTSGVAVSGGWIHSGDLSIFSSEEQAREAIAALQTD
jgi:hypothetical protein